jgi:PAS domain S-box-containing protein
MYGTGHLDAFRKSGIHAVQSTPLISRAGRFLGMLSTHWREPHEPAELEVRLFDILARQAADFIDRKQAEDALHQRTAQFETLLNNAPLGVYLVDSDFRIRHVNPTALPVFGDIADLIGRDFDEVIHLLWPKTYADEIVQRFRHTLETGDPYIVPERIEKRADRHIIEYHEWQIHRMPLPEGDYGVVCYFRDISAQVFARQTVAESEERFRAIVSQTNVGIARLDLTGKLLFINQKLAKMVGYDESELIGKAIWDLTCPVDLEANRALYQRIAAEGDSYEIEYRLVRQDGALIWVNVSVAAIRDAMGKPRATVAVVIDVTERKLAEDALREADRRRTSFSQCWAMSCATRWVLSVMPPICCAG